MPRDFPLALSILALTLSPTLLSAAKLAPKLVPSAAIEKPWVINNVTLIDGTGKPARNNVRVVVAAGKIVAIEAAVKPTNGKAPSNATLVDGTGKFLIPGLWDSHIHLVDAGAATLPLLVTYGITSVRDMGGDFETLNGWRARVKNGSLLGPRIKLCGPMLEGKLLPAMTANGRADHWLISSAEQARSIVNTLADQGVDCIKMRTYATPEVYFALAATAKSRGLPLSGHGPWGIDPKSRS